MKKVLSLLIAMMLFSPSFAQMDEEDLNIEVVSKQKKNAFFIGPKFGGVITSMSQPEQSELADGAGFGISAGLAMKMRFGTATKNTNKAGTGVFGIGLEAKFKQNKVKTIGVDEEGNENASLGVNYFEFPIYAHLYPFVKSKSMNSFYVELGLSFAAVVGRNPNSLTVTGNSDKGYSSVVYNLDSENGKLKGGDIRPLLGIGYTIPNTGLDINARYYIGASNLAKNFESKMNSFEISLAWMFKASK